MERNGHANREKNKRDLQRRLSEVDLTLGIYDLVPTKYIRIDPRNPISIDELEKRLFEDHGIDTTFLETGIEGIYQSTNQNIGGMINGKKNELFMKYYFIQDLASVLSVTALEIEKGNSLLDMCAAPGFKTILCNDLVNGELQVTAIDSSEKRYDRMLGFFGDYNIAAETYNIDAQLFRGDSYDRVLVDAPCSCEGMVVKYDQTANRDISGLDKALEFSQQDVLDLTQTQLQLLQNSFHHLKKGGLLVYSTCAMNTIENEGVIKAFLQQNPNAQVNLPAIAASVDYKKSDLGMRIYPGATRGLYFSRIVKC